MHPAMTKTSKTPTKLSSLPAVGGIQNHISVNKNANKQSKCP